jgi:shikimate kinase
VSPHRVRPDPGGRDPAVLPRPGGPALDLPPIRPRPADAGAPEAGSSRTRRHVVFVGSMGSGKTTVGRLVAGRLGRRFRDNDVTLVLRSGQQAVDKANEQGMVELHRAEADVLLDHLSGSRPAVIAAAASVVDDPRIPPALRDRAVTVWLEGTPDVLVDRARRGRHRPLHDRPDSMRALVEARAERFAAVADVTVDVTTARPAAVVARALEGLAQHGIAPRPRRTRRRA